jgi:hypothetical protein
MRSDGAKWWCDMRSGKENAVAEKTVIVYSNVG